MTMEEQYGKVSYTIGEKSPHSKDASTLDSPLSFENKIENDQVWPTHRPTRTAGTLIWPVVMVCIPILLLCAGLLAMVFGHEVKPVNNIFATPTEPHSSMDPSYVLVNYSGTKIVFLASSLSTVAPLLAGCVMTIASVSLLRRFRNENVSRQAASASEPRQDTLLLGLIGASYCELFISIKCLKWRVWTRQHTAISYAATLLSITILMGLAVTVSDAVLHLVTEMVNFTLYSEVSSPNVDYGRGLNSLCANFNRIEENYGFPCTTVMNTEFVDPNYYSEQAESLKLWHNTSDLSEIRYDTEITNMENGLSYLVSRPETVDPDVGYQATTLGASAKCSLIPASTCNLTRWGPYDKAYTSFNCSSMFWGTLGLAENVSSVNSYRSVSSYLPLLSLKPQGNLQYSFFSDEQLDILYNPAGLNASILPDPNLQPVPDEDLPSSVYMAFAWRSSFGAFTGGQTNEMISSNQTGVYPGIYYVDYFLSCDITTYEIEYVWFDGEVQSVSASQITNGSIVNMWQGTTPYRPSISGGGLVLQDINEQAAIAGTTITDYENTFGQLLSQQVLATIGGYTSPRTVVRQQTEQILMLTKVPKGALGSLIACSLLYPLLGMFLLYKACRALKIDTRHLPTTQPGFVDSHSHSEAVFHAHQSQLTSKSMAQPFTEIHVPKHVISDPVVDRNSTAGIRFVLWGDAGVGPNYNHLSRF